MFEGRPVGDAVGRGHPLLTAPAVVAAVAAGVLGSSGLSLSMGEAREALVGLHAAQASLEAARLHVVRLLAALEEGATVPGGPTVHWMTHTLRIGRGRARADLAAAEATCPDTGVLRGLGEALAGGEVTRAHVDAATSTLRTLPTGLLREHRSEVDALLTEHARSFSPVDARVLGRHLAAVLAPDGIDGTADEAHERRHWEARPDWTGMVRAGGQLDPEGGAVYKAVLDHLASLDRVLSDGESPDTTSAAAGAGTDPAGAGDDPAGGVGVGADGRTSGQRLADAQVEMARLAAAHLRLSTPTVEPPRVVVHCTPEQLADPDATDPTAPELIVSDSTTRGTGGEVTSAGDQRIVPSARPHPGAASCEQTGPISARVLQRHACDAVIERVVLSKRGAILAMDSVGRLATRAQRRALAARDGGCAWPSCSAPVSWTEAHHVVWWSRGGPTVTENLVLLCPRHHTEIHQEHWAITMTTGVPWFIPPPWVDTTRTPVRNTLHTAITNTRHTAQRLVRGEHLKPDEGAAPHTDFGPP